MPQFEYIRFEIAVLKYRFCLPTSFGDVIMLS